MPSKSLRLYIVDAFTKVKYSGNSAAVCLVDHDQIQIITTDAMQKIASEMNLSETAFVSPVNEKDSFTSGAQFHLRWFSPTCEVPLCGHATLATSHVLLVHYGNQSECLEFRTQSGPLFAESNTEGSISIELPSYYPFPVEHLNFNSTDLVKATVGILPVHEVLISPSNKLLIRIKDTVTRKELEGLKPNDSDLLAGAKGIKILGVIVTLLGANKSDCISDDGKQYDFVSRYFAPWMGISEDPVTGSAHSVLGPYWSGKLEKKKLFARQCSKRGGELHVEVLDQRTKVTGGAVSTLQGILYP